MRKLKVRWTILAVALCALAGCQTQPSPRQATPTLSQSQLIQKINENNRRLTTLWARVSFDAEIRDPETKKTDRVYADDGSLQYRAPADFRIRAQKAAVGLILDVGLNPERFWLIAPPPGPDAMWWGFVSHDAGAGRSEIPVRPQDVLQIMAIAPIALSGPSAPTMQFDPLEDVYSLIWYHPGPGHYIISREIRYDRQTLAPIIVLLFDPDGRPSLQARLSKPREVAAPRPRPLVATNYEIYLPASDSKMQLRLRDMQLTHNDAPNDASFRFPDKTPVSKVKQVDAQAQK